MKIGGGNNGIGIHGTHLGPGVRIRYGHSDEARQNIPWVEYDNNGKKTVYAASDAKPDGAGLTMRTMDCMDCHNRPSHSYDLPERAVDKRHERRPDFARAAVRQEEGRGDSQGRLPVAGRGRREDSRGVREVLPRELPGRLGAARRRK